MKPASATVAKVDSGGEDEKFEVGKVYAVKLTTGDQFNGIVLAYDSEPNFAVFDILFRNRYSQLVDSYLCYFAFLISSSCVCFRVFLDGLVILQEGTKPKPLDSKSLRMVNVNYITEMKNLGRVKERLAKNTLVNLDGLIEKENHAISNVEKIGFGVTAEGQMIFDAISKTLPIRWVNKEMLVMGDVFIRSPYHSDCVYGGPRMVNERVKHVLGQERKKLQLSDT
ncbi:RNA-processing, Lsm domain-containing protein [Arabidopsis thaliana]|uniref:RNA-processing, Lsm domain-containing protein n=2 Tax=Arabidopsis thaliana TaxID=3702 RepID=F4I5D2_ARATH|nr:RNA-processing, Lsm domain-containing protein [Arabidopsis thaliana]AEE35035.1 RNA-processing, Lsm domain-containing protein [Arabidopsis thaliana]|eukprot:NP_177179.2 RNA-processing, Lsm domain-containing protein [Arabidopsis thaliana]